MSAASRTAPRRGLGLDFLFRRPVVRAFLGAPSGLAAVVAILSILAVASLAPILLQDRADELDTDNLYGPVTWDHPLGTDSLGRDLLARLLVASRLSLQLGLGAAIIAVCLGVGIGITAALSPGLLRSLLLRSIDTLLTFPGLLTAIFVSTIIGVGAKGAVIGVGVALSANLARLSSTLALSVGGREFIDAARVVGVKRWRLMLRHVLPNIADPLILAFSITVSNAIVTVSALSFLGIGVQSPDYDWGFLLTEGVKAIYLVPAAALGPAGAIAITALTFGLAGEALARAFNPILWTSPRKRQRLEAAMISAMQPSPVGGGLLDLEARARDEAPAEAPAGEPAIEVRDMVVTFPSPRGRVEIVKGVSFTVEKGQVVGIVGESGSGKTMTALTIGGLTPFPGEVSGTIKLHGNDLRELPRAQRAALLARELAYVFQDPSASLNPALKIGTQMTLAPRVHRNLKRRAARTLAVGRLREVRIAAAEKQLERYPHELSGGMRQRVMIATGLMAEPSVLIADEPTTALDVTIQAQIMDLLAEINASHRSTATILISHNLALISQNCQRVLVMYAGSIVEDLDAEQLKTDPKHPYTRALLSAVPELGQDRSETLASIPGEAPDLSELPSGCPFHPRCLLAIERCASELPPLVTRPAEGGRRVACHVANGDLPA